MDSSQLPPSLREAIKALSEGGFILLHDNSSREDETDMVIAAQFVSPQHIAKMRREAGGLICQALSRDLAQHLGLPYAAELLQLASDRYPHLRPLICSSSPYGDPPAFSITINHRSTYTGITDRDRATTIRELVKLCSLALQGWRDVRDRFVQEFRSPGHLHLLIASQDLEERQGHTELSIYLAQVAGLVPSTVICEMLDSRTHRALDSGKARAWAKRRGIPFVEGRELMEIRGLKP